jgi:alpha-glucosidase (family GH31 glycosyl hydrolase)
LKWLLVWLAIAAGAQEPQSVVSGERQGNRFLFRLREGAADVEWVSPSSFRFRRSFNGTLAGRSGTDPKSVDVKVNETEEQVVFTTEYLIATVHKSDLRVKVVKLDGTPLMGDATAAQRRDGSISWERESEPGVRYYGLGGRTSGSLNLRGTVIQKAIPFLITTAGYGEEHVARGRYDFELERLHRGRYRIEIRDSDRIDYFFSYGPTPKEIFEERLKTVGVDLAPAGGDGSFRWMVEQSLSGVVLPPATVTQPLPAALRKRLDFYLNAYIQEVHDRGCPILHPLPVQFYRDPESDKYPEEAMLGDELLVGTASSVYLPQGIWTNLKTNEELRGRQVIQTAETPSIFARNGSIVPLAGAGTLELHYFPRLGAEFFLYEEDAGDYTQAHAAPAADIMRFEIEAKAARNYTWVVHHVEGVKSVRLAGAAEFAQVESAGALRDRTWFYDSALRNLYVRDSVAAGQDHIVNLSF